MVKSFDKKPRKEIECDTEKFWTTYNTYTYNSVHIILKLILRDFIMQDLVEIDNLLIDEKQKLVSVFVWLIEEDKKQNPANYDYKNNKEIKND